MQKSKQEMAAEVAGSDINTTEFILQKAAAAAGGGSALNDLVDLNFGGGAQAQVPACILN